MLYAVSDIHGQDEMFKKLLKKIDFKDSDFMYIIGDAIDRGPGSVNLLKQIKEAPNMQLLIGNHELMMLNALKPDGTPTNEDDHYLWTEMNGGSITYEQFMQLPEDERRSLYEYLQDCKLTTSLEIKHKKYYLTHAFPALEYMDIPVSDIPKDIAWDMVWKHPGRKDHSTKCHATDYPQDGITVIGHVPVIKCNHPFLKPRWELRTVNIDGGCAMKGMTDLENTGLIALRLNDSESFGVSFIEIMEDLLLSDAPDQVLIDTFGKYTGLHLIATRLKYAELAKENAEKIKDV